MVILLLMFFGVIIANGVKHKAYITEYKIKCESKGGVLFLPSGVRGLPIPECRNPHLIINATKTERRCGSELMVRVE